MEILNQDISAAEKMKHYIDINLSESLTAKKIADSASYSQYHAARVFKENYGKTPFEYIRERRLIGSALALRNGKSKVLDIALDFVFDSHEGFTRAFSKAFGIAPKRFASVPEPSDWLIPYKVSNHRIYTNPEDTKMNTAIIFTQIVERPARKLLLCRSKKGADNYFDYCNEFGCVDDHPGESIPFNTAGKIKEALNEPVGIWLPENMRTSGTGEYAHGVEVPASYNGSLPDGFEFIDLPACKMLVFQGEPYNDEQYSDAIDALWERIKKFNPEVYGYEYAPELAPKMQLSPQGWRGYIEMYPIREIVK